MMRQHFAIYVNFMFCDGQGNPRSLEKEAAGKREGAADDDADGDEAMGRPRPEGEAAGAAPGADDVEPALVHPSAAGHLEALLAALTAAELGGGQLPTRKVLVGFSKGAAVLSA